MEKEMIKVVMLIFILTMYSCDIKPTYTDYKVYYNNGNTEVVTLRGNEIGIRLENGCIKENFGGSIICGVRRYKVIKTYKTK